MKRFTDYNPTRKEILNIFGSDGGYEFCQEAVFSKSQITDTEKYKIASLLSLRGEREEALKMINSIKDEKYRMGCLQLYEAWDAEPGEIIN